MAGVKITKRVVDAAEKREKRYAIFDSEVMGFGLRVYPSGQKTYVFEYRSGAGGRSAPKKRVTIGSSTEFTPDEARKRADALRSMVKVGQDPQGDKSAARAAATVETISQKFLKEHVKAKRSDNTATAYEDILNQHVLPRIGKLKGRDVKPSHIAKIHYEMRDTPAAANKTAAVISSMFSYASKMGLVPKGENPAGDIERYKEEGVERFLSIAELEQLGASIRLAEKDGLPWVIDLTKKTKHVPKQGQQTVIGEHAAAALRLLIFTGARLREILNLEWANVDLERGLLFLPKSKSGKRTIVLNAPAMAVLSGVTKIGRYVIASDSAGTDDEKPRADLKRPWQAVRKHAGLEDVRIHDLRHNFASFGAGGGMGLPIIGKLLGHTQASTTQRYAHLDADPVRQASASVGGVDYSGLVENQYQQKVASSNAAMGGLFGLLSAPFQAMKLSDARLKSDIRRVGMLDNGLPVYSYRFGNGPTEIGLIAQEVEQMRPDAVAVHPSGYKMVDYERASV